jgi:hypothetical protein
VTDTSLALAVLAGQPTADELAAVLVVLAARAAGSASGSASGSGPSARRAQWAARSRLMRAPVTTGPGAWRASALPR